MKSAESRSKNGRLKSPAFVLGAMATAILAVVLISNVLDSHHLAFAQGRGLSGPDVDVLLSQNRAV